MVKDRALVQSGVSEQEDWTTRTFTHLRKQKCQWHLIHRGEGGIALRIGSD